jgi:hypothetical protein
MDDKKFRLAVRSWTNVVSCALVGTATMWVNTSLAQEKTSDPQLRVTLDSPAADVPESAVPQRVASHSPANAAPHPLDPALLFAQEKLEHLRKTVHDYEAVMIKQERIDGTLLPAEYMNIKVRNRRERPHGRQPFSVYMRFLRPNAVKGREVIYVEDRNDGNIVAHEAGVLGMIRVNLAPRGTLAMRGNRYPITDAGIENLVEKLIERGTRDRAQGLCDVQFFENAKVMDRTCTMIQVKHEEEKESLDFHIGRIYIDDEHQVPIRYEAYLWPSADEPELPLLESYTYAKLKINVGLSDSDFDPNNSKYEFP